ncbi:UDP-2,3-diacetamido-2,3-dideoxy-D-glucuronate 2-epimerase [subsurface metagenome]
MSPIIKECERVGLDYFILHTGQHYSYNMDRVFFEQLGLPEAEYNLDVGSGSHGVQTGRMLEGIEKVLVEEKPEVVLVEGDTNTVLAGALAAQKLGIEVGHLEAGLRSYDRRMPEEVNRVLTDHCSDYLFAPTEKSRDILLGEGVPNERIFVTGNTIVDAVYLGLELAEGREDLLSEHGLGKGGYFLATVHRQENVDVEGRFSSITKGLELVSESFNVPVVYPVHPRAMKMMKRFSLRPKLKIIDAVDFLTFLYLEKNSSLVLTDSGGVQEEACILGVPCVTLRDNTERPETVDVGSNVIAGTDPGMILEKAKLMLSPNKGWVNPFGDGKAAVRVIDVLRKQNG